MIGKEVRIGQRTVIEVTLSLDTNQYADGDVLAATQEIANAVRGAGTGVIESVVLLDKDDQGAALDLVFLRSNVAIGTENEAVSISDANADEIVGVIEVAAGDYVDLVGSQIVAKNNLGLTFQAVASATSLYVAAISRGTGTYTASGVTLKIGIVAD